MRAGGDQLVLHATGGQTVGQVTDGLVVREVGLPHPALGLVAANLVDLPLARVTDETHRGQGLLVAAADGRRADDGPLRLGAGDRGARSGVVSGSRPRHELGQREGQGPQSRASDGGDLEDGQTPGRDVGAHEVGELSGLGNVDLVQDHDARTLHERHAAVRDGIVLPLVEAGRVGGQLGLDGVQVGQRVTTGLERRAVHDVDDDRAALDVAQELQAEALPPAGTRDEAGHVGDRVAGLPGLDDAQVRHQCGEGVVGDPGSGRAQRGDEGGLAGTRVADEGDIGDGLELQDDITSLPGLAQQMEARGPTPGGRQGEVAPPPGAALGHDDARARTDEIGDDVSIGVLDDGPLGNGQHQALAVGATAPSAHAGCAVARGSVGGAVIGQQSSDPRIHDEHDVAAVTAIAAVGSGQGLVLLAADRGAAVAAVATGRMEDHSIDEAGHGFSWRALSGRRGARGHMPRGRTAESRSPSRHRLVVWRLRPREARR